MSAGDTREEAYHLPLSYILRFILAVLLGRKRDLGRDARGTLATARPRPRVMHAFSIELWASADA